MAPRKVGVHVAADEDILTGRRGYPHDPARTSSQPREDILAFCHPTTPPGGRWQVERYFSDSITSRLILRIAASSIFTTRRS